MAPDGAITGIRHAWAFDDMFSTFATQGIESKTKGEFTREELAPLAEVNVTSLKEYDYFTYRHRRRQKDRAHRSGRRQILARLQGLDPDSEFRAAAQDAAQGARCHHRHL